MTVSTTIKLKIWISYPYTFNIKQHIDKMYSPPCNMQSRHAEKGIRDRDKNNMEMSS